jgi:DNA-directed RNA polymerase specialized sigma24 family protein
VPPQTNSSRSDRGSCRRGLEIDVHRWLDRYIRRLTELPATAEPITHATWRQALGGGHRRVGDWTAYFTRQLTERPWRNMLATCR